MKRKIELGTAIFLIMAFTIMACVITYTFITTKMATTFAMASKYTKLSNVEQLVAQKYVAEYDSTEVMNSILSGYISAVDPYGKYLDAQAYQQYQDEMNGKFAGLGINATYLSGAGTLKVTKVNPGSSADSEDVRPGDIIYRVDGVDVTEMSEVQALNSLKGKGGTSTVLSIYRNENSIEKTVTYSEYTSTTVEWRVIDKNIGYIRFDSFDSKTADEFRDAFKELKEENIKSVIFDVRNNDGASIESACEVLDMILPAGTLVTVETKDGGKTSKIESDEEFIDLSMVVLINKNTQSSAELFAAAVHDLNENATLVGSTTYGKGVAQQVIELSDQTAVYLSTQIYYTPNGVSFEGVGIEPEVAINMSDEDLGNFYALTEDSDVQLQKAIEILK